MVVLVPPRIAPTDLDTSADAGALKVYYFYAGANVAATLFGRGTHRVVREAHSRGGAHRIGRRVARAERAEHKNRTE